MLLFLPKYLISFLEYMITHCKSVFRLIDIYLLFLFTFLKSFYFVLDIPD